MAISEDLERQVNLINESSWREALRQIRVLADERGIERRELYRFWGALMLTCGNVAMAMADGVDRDETVRFASDAGHAALAESEIRLNARN